MSARATLLLGFSLGMGAVLVKLARTAQDRVLPRRKSGVMDLNRAGRAELEKLDLNALAIDRIIENRPYRNKLELISRMIIPKSLYGRIRHRIDVQSLALHPVRRAKAA
jgi:hypothetical protein